MDFADNLIRLQDEWKAAENSGLGPALERGLREIHALLDAAREAPYQTVATAPLSVWTGVLERSEAETIEWLQEHGREDRPGVWTAPTSPTSPSAPDSR